jgi:hypothetical protein
MDYILNMTVSPPGLRGFNRLTLRLNELALLGLIGPWGFGHWPGTKDRHEIRFETLNDARVAEMEDRATAPPAAATNEDHHAWENEGGATRVEP